MTAIAYTVMAMPRCLGAQISLRLPAVTAMGADPKKPQKNRLMKIVWTSLADAVVKAKHAERKKAGRMEMRRPWSSESGAKRIGPVPRLWRKELGGLCMCGSEALRVLGGDVPDHEEREAQLGDFEADMEVLVDRVRSSREAAKRVRFKDRSWQRNRGTNMLLAQVVPSVVRPHRSVSHHFLCSDQFKGLKGSLGPSNVTRVLGLPFEGERMEALSGLGIVSGPSSTSLRSVPAIGLECEVMVLLLRCFWQERCKFDNIHCR
jgi:hypothetical protein